MKLKENFQLPENQTDGVLILDSGIGSLSLLGSLNKSLPHVPLIAFADQKFFPYGEKEESEIVERLLGVAESLINICKPKTVLVACNTASTIVLPELRSKFDLPIVGIVPGVKPAAEQSKARKAVLLATRATVNRSYTDKLIRDFAGDCQIIKIGSSNLASLAESKIASGSICMNALAAELIELKNHQDADCLILGCTHFSFIKDEISSLLGSRVLIIDPVEPVARQVIKVNTYQRNELAQNYLLTSANENAYVKLDIKAYGINEIIYL